MDLRFFEGEPVIVKRKTYTGEYDPDTGEPQASVTETPVEALLYFRQSNGKVTPYEVAYDSELSVIFPYGTVLREDDIFVIRGTEWESDGIVVPITNQKQYDRFLKPPTVMTMKQHKGNVNG